MPKTTVTVDAGVCKMRTKITAWSTEMGDVEYTIESDCPKILRLSWSVKPLNPFDVVEVPFKDNPVYLLASEELEHAACPVPCAIVKAIEVASGLGLKRDVSIKIE